MLNFIACKKWGAAPRKESNVFMKKKQSNFSGQVGFVLAAAGSAVGVGNLWRFPYLAAKDGGGLFLLIYLVLVVTIGFTLLTSDIAIGRKTKKSAIGAYTELAPKWKFLGILTFFVPVLIMTYYAVIGGWITKYGVVYLTGQASAAAQDGYFTAFITSPVSPVVFALLFMAVGILVMLYVNHPALPEIWDGLQNTHPDAVALPIFPIMFVSIACGAISGFHATQSPLMARCMTSERHGRPVFYGAMITEGIVALIWAAAATYFFHENGMGETNASIIVDAITKDWLGAVGGVLAILGVIAAPITSGDTAFRSARLIVADFLGMEQKSMRRRLYICIPMFLVAISLLLYSLRDKDGFDMIWRYFAWANQTLSVFTLWAITVYLVREKKGRYYYVTYFPALFMTAVCTTYICIAPEGFGLGPNYALGVALIAVVLAAIWFNIWYFKTTKKLW